MCIQAVLNGRQRINMLVDSGSAQCVIDRSLVKELELPLRFPRRAPLIDNENLDGNQAIVPELKIGELNLQSVPVFVTDLHPLSCVTGHKLDGILGDDILHHFVTTINIRKNLIVLKAGNEFKPFMTMERPVTTTVVVNLADKLNQTFVIDTGSEDNIMPRSVAVLFKAHSIQAKNKSVNAAGKFRNFGWVKLSEIRLAGLKMRDVWFSIAIPGAKTENIPSIGRNLLKKLCLTLDPFTDKATWELYSIEPAEQLEDEIKVLMSIGRYSQVIKETNEGISYAPKNINLRRLRAEALFQLKKYNECVQQATKCIQLGCTLDELYFLRARAQGKLNHQKAAIDDILKVASMTPMDPFVQLSCGKSLSAISADRQAIDRFNYALTIQSDISQIYEERAVVYEKLHEYKLALADFNKAIDVDPEDGNYYNNRGVLYEKLSQYKSALTDFNKAIKFDSDQADYYSDRATVYGDLHDYQHALEDCDKAIELEPEGASHYSTRAWVRNGIGKDWDKSIRDCNKAISIDNNFASAYRNRAIAYVGKDDLPNAILDLN